MLVTCGPPVTETICTGQAGAVSHPASGANTRLVTPSNRASGAHKVSHPLEQSKRCKHKVSHPQRCNSTVRHLLKVHESQKLPESEYRKGKLLAP